MRRKILIWMAIWMGVGAVALVIAPLAAQAATESGETAGKQVLAPSISLNKTVGTTMGVCATESEITVEAGTTVYYCYTVTNTGDVTLNLHDLVDDQLGKIFSSLNYALAPEASIDTVAAGLSIPVVINVETTNTATWTAYNVSPPDQVTASASATVHISGYSTYLPLVLRR